MKAIMVMFDSLRRDMLEPYGCDWTVTPNFSRLAEKSVRFTNHYIGSMPCMPARRELHTGRYNFMHRSWGPMEPFDDSMPEMLSDHGIHTHLVSDHKHYWADGGATYHTRYTTWEEVRGQQGDPWKCDLKRMRPVETAFEVPTSVGGGARVRMQDAVNRIYTATEETMPQAEVFRLGLEFVETNKDEDNWFLQIETFDPHEPFYCMQEYKDLYPSDYRGKRADWPPYYYVKEEKAVVDQTRREYASLLSMCDHYLGKVLDMMDRYQLWEDTMLIVNTDHGYLLGEHEWWSKNVMPVYNEIANIPLFIYDPRSRIMGESREALTQTIDIPATLLDFFGIPLPPDMQGVPLGQTIHHDAPVRDYAFFGYHNGQANITDGTHLYMRSPVNADSGPLYEYTLMPTHMRGFFSGDELRGAKLTGPLTFTKGMPVLKVAAKGNWDSPVYFDHKLFCISDDPSQETELRDAELECRMANLLIRAMKENAAPQEQFERLGLKPDGMTAEDIKASNAWKKASREVVLPQNHAWSRAAAAMMHVLMEELGQESVVSEEFQKCLGGKMRIEAEDVSDFIKTAFGDRADYLLYVTGLASRDR